MNAQCILFTGVRRVELGEATLPAPTPDDIVIETILSCISPGTELRCLAGEEAGLGNDSFPFVPGYSLVGKVIKADAAGQHAAGSLVFSTGNRHASVRCAWGGHLSHAVVPAASAYAIPAGISLANASLLKLAAITHRGLRLAECKPGEKVVVVGLGPIGQLSARIFQTAGADVIGTDLSLERVESARAAGVKAEVLGPDGDISRLRTLLPEGAAIVVDATGFVPALTTSLSLLADKPWDESSPDPSRLIIQGSYAKPLSLPYATAFAKELRISFPRDSQLSDMEAVGHLMVSNELTAEDLVSHMYPVSRAAETYAELQQSKIGLLTAVFDWRR